MQPVSHLCGRAGASIGTMRWAQTGSYGMAPIAVGETVSLLQSLYL